jgi:hypothetical protein
VGQPYLIAMNALVWPKGALEQSLDLALPRGVSLRGTVTEERTGQPVPGAIVDFAPRVVPRQNRQGVSLPAETASDDSFQLGTVPSPGYLFVKGPSDDYVLQEIGHRMIQEGQSSGGRFYAHAHPRLDLKPGIDVKDLHLTLRPGVTVQGQVVGPDGQPVQDAWMISRIILDPRLGSERTWNGRIHGNVRNGRFELHGLDPDVETPVSFLDPKRKLGATVNLSGKSIALMTIANRAGRVAVGATVSFSGKSPVRGPITVRLEPCGAARVRLVDPDGKPVAGRLPRDISITMVVTPGPPRSRTPDKAGRLFADETDLNVVDPVDYEQELVADPEGRLALPVLISGATYRLIDLTTARDAAGPQVRKEFTIQPGETLDLGDLVIAKAQR